MEVSSKHNTKTIVWSAIAGKGLSDDEGKKIYSNL